MKFSVVLEKRIVVHIDAPSRSEASVLAMKDDDRGDNLQEWDKAEAEAMDAWESDSDGNHLEAS